MTPVTTERLLGDAIKAYNEEHQRAEQYKDSQLFWHSEYEAVNMRLRLYPLFFSIAVIVAFVLTFYFRI